MHSSWLRPATLDPLAFTSSLLRFEEWGINLRLTRRGAAIVARLVMARPQYATRVGYIWLSTVHKTPLIVRLDLGCPASWLMPRWHVEYWHVSVDMHGDAAPTRFYLPTPNSMHTARQLLVMNVFKKAEANRRSYSP